MKAKIEQFATRPSNWNSYEARPVSMPCKVTALVVARLLASQKALLLDVNMTGDSEVTISCQIGAYKTRWQIDADGDIAVMAHDKNEQVSFYDMTLSRVLGFIQDLKNEHI